MTQRSTRLFDQSTRVILEHRIVRSERSNDRRTGLYFMFMICILYIYIYIYIMSEKSILTRKSQKNKLICVCVCVFFFVFLFLFFMSEESVLTNKIKERKKTS